MSYQDPGEAWMKVAEAIMALAAAIEHKAKVDEAGLKFDMKEAGYEDDETCPSTEPTDVAIAVTS